MGAVRLLIRAEVRRRWRSLIVVTLLVAFTGGVTLAAVAGARRTATSFDRFKESTKNHDVLLFAEGVDRADVKELRALPRVEAIGYARQLAMTRPDGEFVTMAGPLDGELFRDVDRLRIVAGRMPRLEKPEEVVVPEPLAREEHLHLGDTIPVQGYTPEQVGALSNDTTDFPKPAGPAATLRVVGISRLPIDLGLQGDAGGVLMVQRSFVEKYGKEIGNFSGETGGVLFVRLTDGAAGGDRFLGQLRRVLGGRNYDVDPAALTVGGIQDSIDLLALGILVFGAIAGVAGLIALGLIISRQVALLAGGQVAVLDLGLSRNRRAIAVAAPLLIALGIGALAAILVSWFASPLLPFGVAGRAEPHPGFAFNAAVLIPGALALAVVTAVIAAHSAWRVTRRGWSVDHAHRRPSVVSRWLETVGLSPPATIGVRMALEPGRGRTAVPVRSALVGAAVAVLGVAAVAVFAASLDQLGDSPRAFGVGWNAVVDDTGAELVHDGKLCGGIKTRLVDVKTVSAVASICSLSITLGGRAVGALGYTSELGDIQPTVLSGRAPVAPDEVALGSQTLDQLGLDVGDRVTAKSPAGDVRLRIVGRVVVPSVIDPQAVADGAILTGAGLGTLENPDNLSAGLAPVVRFRPGVDVDRAAQQIERLPKVGRDGNPGVLPVTAPLEVERIEQLDRLPVALAIFLTILGGIAVGHLLVTSVQRRRHDFAVLKSLGFSRRQLSATVCVQATTVAVIGLVVGVIGGVVAGKLLWRAAVGQVGLLPEVDVPVFVLAGLVIGTLVIANVVAAFPARIAASTEAAKLLRTD